MFQILWYAIPMNLFEAIAQRRSIRKFTEVRFPDEAVRRALEAALLAPNSSNVQTWDFHWVKSSDLQKGLIEACMSQSAARTATQFIVATVNPRLWRRSSPYLLKYVEEVSAPKMVQQYYRKLIPITYSPGFFNLFAPFKWIISTVVGFFRPMLRGPYTRRDLQEIAVKSSALACENFMLAITAQGGATCPIEGFDPKRLQHLLKLPRGTTIVMVIAIGYEGPRGTWGHRMRIPFEETVHIYN